MTVGLDRINPVPETPEDFSFQFNVWLAALVDTINETFTLIESRLNVNEAPQYTTAQITALAATAPDGSLWYDTDTNELKAKVNSIVVVIA